MNAIRRFFSVLGPGLITGASDDDPSGISTYSIAGATAGFSMLWIALVTTPMMAVIQGMCARVGMVCNEGLGVTMRRRLPRWLLWPLCAAVIVANTINAGADLQGMTAAVQLVIGGWGWLWILLFGAVLIAIQVYLSYDAFSRVVKWLTIALFAYIVTAFVVHPPWGIVFKHLVVPEVRLNAQFLTTLVAVLGTTITPYLFFWQAALEVEEGRKKTPARRRPKRQANPKDIKEMHLDVNFGMIFSNLVAFFIIVTTASTLNAHGHAHIASAADAARALEPLAGRFAGLLFSLGMVGTGLLAIPALVGSSAYVAAEAFKFKEGLDETPSNAPQFYGVLVAGIVVAMAMGFLRIDPIGALFWSAVINGVVAVPLLAIIVWFASERKVMGEWTSSTLARIWGWGTVAAMTLAAIGMFAFWGRS